MLRHAAAVAAACASPTRSPWRCASSVSPARDRPRSSCPTPTCELRRGAAARPAGPARHRRRPGHQEGRTCRVQYTTTSDRLRDDVIFLVRSLGGVVYGRTRPAEGRRPGRAAGRAGQPPPRRPRPRHPAARGLLAVPADPQEGGLRRHGGGRPMRFIDAIEPAGEADTRVHPGGGRGLALRHRRLPRHAQHAQRCVHHPRRGAEHLAGADEDVPDPAGLRLQDRGHRRRHPGRPAQRHEVRPARRSRASSTASRTSSSTGSPATTSYGTGWSARSSRRTTRPTPAASSEPVVSHAQRLARRPPRGPR